MADHDRQSHDPRGRAVGAKGSEPSSSAATADTLPAPPEGDGPPALTASPASREFLAEVARLAAWAEAAAAKRSDLAALVSRWLDLAATWDERAVELARTGAPSSAPVARAQVRADTYRRAAADLMQAMTGRALVTRGPAWRQHGGPLCSAVGCRAPATGRLVNEDGSPSSFCDRHLRLVTGGNPAGSRAFCPEAE